MQLSFFCLQESFCSSEGVIGCGAMVRACFVQVLPPPSQNPIPRTGKTQGVQRISAATTTNVTEADGGGKSCPPGLPEKLRDRPLRLVIVGHNPSAHAWSSGHYYSNPSNRCAIDAKLPMSHWLLENLQIKLRKPQLKIMPWRCCANTHQVFRSTGWLAFKPIPIFSRFCSFQ